MMVAFVNRLAYTIMYGKVLSGRWKSGDELGSGCFSKVYTGHLHIGLDLDSLSPVAIKIPTSDAGCLMLETEAKMMNKMTTCIRNLHPEIPHILHHSHYPPYIVMEKVGTTLLDLFMKYHKLSWKTILMVAVQTISVLEEMHEAGIIHRDVKPDNITIGSDIDDPNLYFIDFGLSREVIRDHIHVSYSENCHFQGSPYFASENTLRGIHSSRRDDLESLGYVLLFLHKGSLPWFQIDFSKESDVAQISAARAKIPLTKLCENSHPVFFEYLKCCQLLEFNEKPNYRHLKEMFANVAEDEEIELDWEYDWVQPTIRKEKAGSFSKLEEVRTGHIHAHSINKHSNSLSRNMQLLVTGQVTVSPGMMIESLRHREISVLEPPISSTGSSDLQTTPVHQPKLDITRVRGFSLDDTKSGSNEEGSDEQQTDSEIRKHESGSC